MEYLDENGAAPEDFMAFDSSTVTASVPRAAQVMTMMMMIMMMMIMINRERGLESQLPSHLIRS
jgi:hypothetical protein